MRLFLEDLWYGAIEAPGNTWAWFNALNREEWLLVLTITCAPRLRQLAGFSPE